MRSIAIGVSLIALCACTSQDRVRTVTDEYGRQLSVAHTGADANGTPMLTVVGQFDQYRRFHLIYGGSGEDYFAGFVRGGLAGAFEGAGMAGFGALLRPARTNVSNVSSSAGASATGGSVNANLSNHQTQHQRATATSDASASTGAINVSGGGTSPLFPNGTTLHTPNGDIRVDPTVTVSQ